MNSTKKCSKCKKVGHNVRTCQRQKILIHTANKELTAKKHNQPQRLKTETGTLSEQHINDAYEQLTHSSAQDQHLQHEEKGKLSEDGRYSPADLETLWALQHTGIPHDNLMYVREFKKFVSYVESLPPSHQPTTETWIKFLKKIPVSAKTQLIETYPKATGEHHRIQGDTAMSTPLIDALSYEKSTSILSSLAARVGLTEDAAARISQREETHVLLSLAKNPQTPPQCLEEMQQKINESYHQSGRGTPFKETQNVTPTNVMNQLAEHPNLTEKMKKEYLNILHSGSDKSLAAPNFYQKILSNPSLTERELSEQLSMLEREEHESGKLTQELKVAVRRRYVNFCKIVIYSHPNCPEKKLREHLEEKHEKMKRNDNQAREYSYSPFRNPKLTSEDVQRYYTTAREAKNLTAMSALAQNPHAPVEVLKSFVEACESYEKEWGVGMMFSPQLRKSYEKVKSELKNNTKS